MKTTRKLTMAQAISEAIAQEMKRDDTVFVMGEDIGAYGGIFGATSGLLEQFGKDRIMDTPISETAFIGTATLQCPEFLDRYLGFGDALAEAGLPMEEALRMASIKRDRKTERIQ